MFGAAIVEGSVGVKPDVVTGVTLGVGVRLVAGVDIAVELDFGGVAIYSTM